MATRKKQKTKTTKLLDRFFPTKPTPGKKSARKTPIEGIVYFLNEAPIVKLTAITGGLYLLSKIVRDIDSYLEGDVNKDKIITIIPPVTPIFIKVWYDPSNDYASGGSWKEPTIWDFEDNLKWYPNNNIPVDLNVIPNNTYVLPMTIKKIAEYYYDILMFNPDKLNDSQICKFVNISLTVSKVMNDMQVKALHNSFLNISSDGLWEYLEDHLGIFSNWNVTPFNINIISVMNKLANVGALN